MDVGPSELVIVLVLLLVLFGGSQIPKLARNLGRAQAEFKKGLAGDGDTVPADEEAVSTSPK